MKHIFSIFLLLSFTSTCFAITLEDYTYEEDDIVSSIGNGKRQFMIVAQPVETSKCKYDYRPVKEGLLMVGSKPYSDYISHDGYDDVVKASSFVSVYSKNEDVPDITSVIKLNPNYSNLEEIYFITYHSLNPSYFQVTGRYSSNSISDLIKIKEKDIITQNIGCYFIMAENQNSDYGIGYYWLYVTKSFIKKYAEVSITTKYLGDKTTLSYGKDENGNYYDNIYSTIRQHTYFVMQK